MSAVPLKPNTCLPTGAKIASAQSRVRYRRPNRPPAGNQGKVKPDTKRGGDKTGLEQPPLAFCAEQRRLRCLAQYAENQRNQQDLQHDRGRDEFRAVKKPDYHRRRQNPDQADRERENCEVPQSLAEGGPEARLVACTLYPGQTREKHAQHRAR
jgi:hypothetical protein